MTRWMGTARWTYNQGVASGLTDRQALRSRFVNNDVYKLDQTRPQWVLETPYEIRDTAIIDLAKATKSSKALVASGHAKHFKLSFRSKKDQQQAFVVRNRDYKPKSIAHFSIFRGAFKLAGVSSEIKARESLPASISYDARLVRTRLSEWYLCIPEARDDLSRALGGTIAKSPQQSHVFVLSIPVYVPSKRSMIPAESSLKWAPKTFLGCIDCAQQLTIFKLAEQRCMATEIGAIECNELFCASTAKSGASFPRCIASSSGSWWTTMQSSFFPHSRRLTWWSATSASWHPRQQEPC